MFKFGIIAVGYQCAADFEEIIFPWLNRDNFYIALVNAKFKDFPLEQTDKTAEFMLTTQILNSNVIFVEPGEIEKEHEARNAGLKAIREKFGEMDYYWLLDMDERYTKENIDNIVKFIENRSSVSWFAIQFKNFVFDRLHYLEETFVPPRIFKTNVNKDIKLDSMFWDNDFYYQTKDKKITYKELSSICISKNICVVDHFSWMSDDRGKAKVIYQLSHFNGQCSYKWDEAKNCLAFNEDFFYSRNLPLPKVITETTR